MLTSFVASNFRLFERIEIDPLARVNLLVGKNNSGKSAFLEAIELYASGISTKVLSDLITKRQEAWKEPVPASNSQAIANPVRHLFFGHHLPAPYEEGIVLGPVKAADQQIHVKIAAYRVEGDQEGVLRTIFVPSSELQPDATDLDFALIAQENEKTWRVLRLDRDIQSETRMSPRPSNLLAMNQKHVTQVVPTRNMTEEKVASLWDTIALTDLEEEVVAGLKLLDDRIAGVAFVEGDRSRERAPLVKLNHMSERLPLRSLGDGVLRLFHIMVALVNARDGILLVDEFENGLHWSVQSKLWEMIFKLSERLNVQVFATTHSRDCIKSFGEVWQKHEALGGFFRLNSAQPPSTIVTVLNCETLADSLETEVEVRL